MKKINLNISADTEVKKRVCRKYYLQTMKCAVKNEDQTNVRKHSQMKNKINHQT